MSKVTEDIRLTCTGCKQLIEDNDHEHWKTCDHHPARIELDRIKTLARMAKAQFLAGHHKAGYEVLERILTA